MDKLSDFGSKQVLEYIKRKREMKKEIEYVDNQRDINNGYANTENYIKDPYRMNKAINKILRPKNPNIFPNNMQTSIRSTYRHIKKQE